MAVDLNRVKEIFLEAAELPDDAARIAVLDRACGGDAELRGRVEMLLRAHNPAGSFLGTPAAVLPQQEHDKTIGHDASAGTALKPDLDPADLSFLAPATRPDSLGRIGHYEVLQVLGKGAFGIVFRAFDDILQRVVAVKVMAPQIATTSPARKRFLREARTSAAIRHENVVQVYEVGEQPLPYLVMEFIPGETLQQRLSRTGPVDALETVRIGRQIAEGLAAAHATDLIHRDIKPGNILIEGGQQRAKITDFGLARAADDASISQSGIIAGTPMYMAPEQALGKTLDQRADLFSLGSVLYQMVAGRPPFRANSTVAVLKRVADDTPRPIREITPETPPWLCDIIAKLHAKNPDDRYQSAREVADVLGDCETQLKANLKLKDFSRIPKSQAKPSAGRSPRMSWIATALVLLVPISAGGFVISQKALKRSARPVQGLADFPAPLGFPKKLPRPAPPAANDARAGNDPKPDAQKVDHWVSLFDGKTLAGWKNHPDQPGDWKVEEGQLVGRGRMALLYSDRGDFGDFDLRFEAKVNSGGYGGIFLRSPEYPPLRGNVFDDPKGHRVVLSANSKHEPSLNTGSIKTWTPKGHMLQANTRETPPDEWFKVEILTRGPEVAVRVNDKIAGFIGKIAESAHNVGPKGFLVLEAQGDDTVIHIRKIEIKELPPIEKAPPPALKNPEP